MSNSREHKNAIYTPHFNGKSLALTLNPDCVRTLGINEQTVVRQKVVPGGLMLEMYDLSPIVIPSIKEKE